MEFVNAYEFGNAFLISATFPKFGKIADIFCDFWIQQRKCLQSGRKMLLIAEILKANYIGSKVYDEIYV